MYSQNKLARNKNNKTHKKIVGFLLSFTGII